MTQNNESRRPALAKFTPPSVETCVVRNRLFKQIDAAQQQSGLWISGPGGSGKTVLTASYLEDRKHPVIWMRLDAGDSDPATFFYYLRLAAEELATGTTRLPALLAPENLTDLPQFTRVFFRDLYQAMPRGSVLVFDNSQEQTTSEPAIDLLTTAIIESPNDINVIALSRDNPPGSLTRAFMHGKLGLIDWPELSFRPEELRQLANNQQSGVLDDNILQQAIEESKGWAAGFLLLLQKNELNGRLPSAIEPSSEQALFDYFASEILSELENDDREFLLVTAFSPILTAELAERLTLCKDSGARLNRLVRLNHFTVALPGAESIFEYHPLFRHFLLTQARIEFSNDKIEQIQRNAAHSLVDTGRSETAIPLLLETKDWEPLIKVLFAQAPQLLAQGRHQRLAAWLRKIPAELSASDPWIVYWQGIAHMALDLDKSYQLLSQAFESFLETDELTGASLAWAGAVESMVHGMSGLERMDSWLIKLETLLEKLPEEAMELKAMLAPQIIAIAALRVPKGVDFEPWLALTQALLTQPIDPTQRIMASFVLISYFIWHGQQPARVEQILSLQEQILREETVRPLALITAKLTATWHAWIGGNQDRCRQAIEEGLAIAKESGVYHWNFILLTKGIANALLHGDCREARAYFKQLDPLMTVARDFDHAHYHNQKGCLEMLEGRPEKALLQQRLALKTAEDAGSAYLIAETTFGLSQALHAVGDQQQAARFLRLAQERAKQYESNTLSFQCGLLSGYYKYKDGDVDTAASTLQETFEHAKHHGYSGFSWWLPAQITELCAFALTRGITPDFVCNLIRQFGLQPPSSGYIPANWPWPIRIETLGTFNLMIDDKPLRFTSKAQRRPTDLLKALIALGTVGVSSERLAEVLWPDADGDAAARSLQTTIHRLRKLLQHDDAIVVKQGLVGLNPHIVWVDVQALENTLKNVATIEKDALPTLAHHILKLYRGAFLEHEAEESWAISLRERLRGRLIKGLHQLAERLYSTGETALTRSLYEKAITIDPLSEDSYRCLMASHALADNKAEALAVYTRVSETLHQQFNTTPSAATSQLANAITSNDHKIIVSAISTKA